MAKYYIKKSNDYDENKSIVFWAMMTFIVLFLFVAPFYKALFNGYQSGFEGAVYSVVMWSAIALLFLSIHFFRHWQLSTHRDLLCVFVWLIPLTYFMSTSGAASSHLAMNEVYIKVSWAVFFLIGAYFASSTLGSKVFQYGLIGSGYMIVIYGFMNWFGNVSYQDAILTSDRLSNVFQYPNAYAAYLIALLICSLILVSVAKRWYYQLIPSIMLVPIFLSILLTLSRGALLVLPIFLVVYLIFIPWYKQLMNLLYLGTVGITSLILFNQVTAIRIELTEYYSLEVSLKGWLLLVIVSVVVFAFIYVLNRYMGQFLAIKFEQKNVSWKNVILPVLLVLVAIGAYLLLITGSTVFEKLPEDIRLRVESINSETRSVYLRNTFYEDAIKIANDYPWFGAGGGGWSALYYSYQSYPYKSTQAHNFYMQYLVEAGWVGLAILFILVIYVLVLFIRYVTSSHQNEFDEDRLIFPLFSLIILGHSFIDFDMSFVYLSSIVFLTLGISVSKATESIHWVPGLSRASIYRNIGKGYSGLLLVISVVVLFRMIPALQADSQYRIARDIAMQTGNYNQFQPHLDKALDLSPQHPEYNIFKANVLMQLSQQTQDGKYVQEVEHILQKLGDKEPFNRNLVELKYALLVDKQELEQALEIMESTIMWYPWDINLYERTTELYYTLGSQADENQLLEVRDKYWDDAISLVEIIESGANFIKTLPQSERYAGISFKVNAKVSLQVGKIHISRGQYEEASQLLKPHLSKDLDVPENRDVLRWYLASMKIQDKEDEAWWKLLISKDSKEEQRVQMIVNSSEVQ